MNTGQKLEQQCEELGLSISKVLREADVNPSIISRWKENEPKSFVILKKIQEAIDKQAKEKAEQDAAK